jgi:hypothetical protein
MKWLKIRKNGSEGTALTLKRLGKVMKIILTTEGK